MGIYSGDCYILGTYCHIYRLPAGWTVTAASGRLEGVSVGHGADRRAAILMAAATIGRAT